MVAGAVGCVVVADRWVEVVDAGGAVVVVEEPVGDDVVVVGGTVVAVSAAPPGGVVPAGDAPVPVFSGTFTVTTLMTVVPG